MSTVCTDCPNRPRCERRWCENKAVRSVWHVRWGTTPEGPSFMCEPCYQMTREVMSKPMRGIDRPQNAPDDWRPSLEEMMDHARIAIAFNERQQRERTLNAMGTLRRPGDEKFTPAQLQQMMVLRRHLQASRLDPTDKSGAA